MANQLLTLYGRLGCHLCEDMHNDLLVLQKQLGFELQIIDVDSDPVLVEKYGTRVPVLASDKGEICHYFLDKQALLQYF